MWRDKEASNSYLEHNHYALELENDKNAEIVWLMTKV